MDWFLYDNGLRHERVNATPVIKSQQCENTKDFVPNIAPHKSGIKGHYSGISLMEKLFYFIQERNHRLHNTTGLDLIHSEIQRLACSWNILIFSAITEPVSFLLFHFFTPISLTLFKKKEEERQVANFTRKLAHLPIKHQFYKNKSVAKNRGRQSGQL